MPPPPRPFFFLAKESKHFVLYTNFYKKVYMLEYNFMTYIESFFCAVIGHKRS